MLAGEPGIGKTRTSQELAALAEERGVQVLWGRCYEEEGIDALLALGPLDTIGHLLWDANRDLQESVNSDRHASLQGLQNGAAVLRVAESSRSRICSLRAFKDATAAWPCSRVDMVSRCRSNSSVR